MAYNKKTWLARLGQGLNKFIFNGGSKVTLESSPDLVTQEGTPLSADNMNDLEQRIADEFGNVNGDISSLNGQGFYVTKRSWAYSTLLSFLVVDNTLMWDKNLGGIDSQVTLSAGDWYIVNVRISDGNYLNSCDIAGIVTETTSLTVSMKVKWWRFYDTGRRYHLDTSNVIYTSSTVNSGNYTCTEDCYIFLNIRMQANSSGSASIQINGENVSPVSIYTSGVPLSDQSFVWTSPLLAKGDTFSFTTSSNSQSAFKVFGVK